MITKVVGSFSNIQIVLASLIYNKMKAHHCCCAFKYWVISYISFKRTNWNFCKALAMSFCLNLWATSKTLPN